jgi:PIN domain nuclease of toxin-antitoxin system
VRSLLVDTNVIVWLLLGDRPRVSETARLALEDERNKVAVSAATVWEIAINRSGGGWHHRDPFDRLLVAQALTDGLELVSADARLGAYGVDLLW